MDARKGPLNGVDRTTLAQMVQAQLSQSFDAYRMREFWRRLFAGDNDPEEMAEGMCLALSGGQYVERDKEGMVLNITINGSGDPEQIAAAVKASMVGAHSGA